MQEYIDAGWHTVPLTGKLERQSDGSKTLPGFPKDWRAKYQEKFNTNNTELGGAITGEVSGIIAIDCDNAVTWELFRTLDPDYNFVFLSKGKGYPAGTLIYKYDADLAETFSINNGDLALDFYSDRGFIYLATTENKTKVTLRTPLPELQPVPASIKILLKQLLASTKAVPVDDSRKQNVNIMTAQCLAPLVEQFVSSKEFMPGLFKIITPKDFRTLPEYVENGYLHPNNVPEGRGSEYLMKVSAILGADISIDEAMYVEAMTYINMLFDDPLPQKRLDSTVTDPMMEGKSSVNGKPIWQYDPDWKRFRLILKGKRQTNLELAFDDLRNTYYVVNAIDQRIKTFNRDAELMAYIEAAAVDSPKKIEVKRSLPIVNVGSFPNKSFGFNESDDPTARTLNTFVQTPELLIFNNPDVYMDKYKRPDNTLRYLQTLVPDDKMRTYLLQFVKTKLSTFNYSPVILYFMGKHGSGKDLFVGLLETILGNVSRPTTKEFLEMFNAWMLDSYFVQLDEYGNQLATVREREEALGKIKAYTGKQQVQIRQMRTDSFTYKHNVTFIMTANKNPLMLEEGDRRIAFFETPNVLAEADWVLENGGVAAIYQRIQAEIKDFCYYLATEVETLSASDYVKPPESGDKRELIAQSMYAAQRIAYCIRHGMRDHLINLAEEVELEDVADAIKANDITVDHLKDLYMDLTDGNGKERSLMKTLRGEGITLQPSTSEGRKIYRVHMKTEPVFKNEEDN